jgi:hypothetical protein
MERTGDVRIVYVGIDSRLEKLKNSRGICPSLPFFYRQKPTNGYSLFRIRGFFPVKEYSIKHERQWRIWSAMPVHGNLQQIYSYIDIKLEIL